MIKTKLAFICCLFALTTSAQTANCFQLVNSNANTAVANTVKNIVQSDFNADGYLDLAVACSSNSVSILMGSGTGTFAPAVNYWTGTGLSSITVCDYNSDGVPDLAASDQGANGVSVILNSGNGTFSPPLTFTLGGQGQACSIATGDFNGDGFLDFVSSTPGNYPHSTVSVLVSTGLGTYAPCVDYNAGASTNPAALVIDDFTGDGYLDIAIAKLSANKVYLLTGNGNGTFSPGINSNVGTSPCSIITGDFNEDGMSDIATANGGSNTISILLRLNNSGFFAAAVNYSVSTFPAQLTKGDFNGDGHMDIATTNPLSNNVSVLTGSGTGTFSTAVNFTTTGTYPNSTMAGGILAADFNNDLKTDLVVGVDYEYINFLYNAPSMVSANSGSICVGSSFSLTPIGLNTYTLNSTPAVVTPTVSTNYTITGVNNCGPTTQIVNVVVDNTCQKVWPGDANSDGVANNLDILELGLHYGQTGFMRMPQSNSWQPFIANNWTGSIANGKNLNHSDCNGDGTIDISDTLAIWNNYGLVHLVFKNAQTTTKPDLSIVPDQAAVAKGNWGTASIYLGSASNPVSNINGLAYTVNFDNVLIEQDSVWIEQNPSFINLNNDNLKFGKRDFWNSKIYVATTHTVGANVSGFGKIATLHYKIAGSLATDQTLQLALSGAHKSDMLGGTIPLTSGSSTVSAIGSSVGIKNNNSKSINLLVYPNPNNGLFTVDLKANSQVMITNSLGEIIVDEKLNSGKHTLDIHHQAKGIYFIKVSSDKGFETIKIIKE
jgi:hypothetical protein